MILRRVIAHLRKQEWTAIGLDFLIVVLGVFVATQATNWNDTRSNERAYQDALHRLAEESREMIDDAAQTRVRINERLSAVQPAIDVLRTCQTGSQAEAVVNRGLNAIRGADGPRVMTLTLDQLVSDERLLSRQNNGERAALREFHDALHDLDETAESVGGLAIASVEDINPRIGFSDIVDPSETMSGGDIRHARINAPLAEVCRDHAFLHLFYNWERTHVFQLRLVGQLESIVTDNARELGFPGFEAEDQWRPRRVE